jgi:hypothetical protein
MLMQILRSGDIDISFDDKRPKDENNPKGYFELEGGKIINRLMDNTFDFDRYKGSFIKITAYGLKFLPQGRYKIIYIERNIEEVLDSMEKMMGKSDISREESRNLETKLNSSIKKKIRYRDDSDVLFVNYNEIIKDPTGQINRIIDFLGLPQDRLEKMVETVDMRLYRMRKENA